MLLGHSIQEPCKATVLLAHTVSKAAALLRATDGAAEGITDLPLDRTADLVGEFDGTMTDSLVDVDGVRDLLSVS